jgi:hypothetical protein
MGRGEVGVGVGVGSSGYGRAGWGGEGCELAWVHLVEE